MIEISDERIKAGAEYLDALNKLGIRPDCLMWGYDKVANEWVLILATRYFDAVGPLAISQTLFRAYNASATPKEIDPFIIQLHSPRQTIIRQLLNLPKVRAELHMEDGTHRPAEDDEMFAEMGNLHVPFRGIYRAVHPKANNDNLAKQWAAIARRVENLAA